jgi:succinylarginine dihydrolase
MKARVHVMLKQGVLDPQGKAIAHALGSLGFGGVNEVRQGRSSTSTSPKAIPTVRAPSSSRCASSSSPTQ